MLFICNYRPFTWSLIFVTWLWRVEIWMLSYCSSLFFKSCRSCLKSYSSSNILCMGLPTISYVLGDGEKLMEIFPSKFSVLESFRLDTWIYSICFRFILLSLVYVDLINTSSTFFILFDKLLICLSNYTWYLWTADIFFSKSSIFRVSMPPVNTVLEPDKFFVFKWWRRSLIFRSFCMISYSLFFSLIWSFPSYLCKYLITLLFLFAASDACFHNFFLWAQAVPAWT